jgi:hypothetical protein
MIRICLHPVELISVKFKEVRTTDNVQHFAPSARCTRCGLKLPTVEPNAQRAIDLAFAGIGKENPEHE